MAIRAPSTHNTQPWWFGFTGDAIDLYADRSRALPVVDPEGRELVISCGAALEHLRLALRFAGFDARVACLPEPAEPDLLARVSPRSPATNTAEEDALYHAIPLRRTNRRPYAGRSVTEPVLAALEAAAHDAGAHLLLLWGEDRRRAVVDLIAQGARLPRSDAGFRAELASWIRPRGGGDGLSGHALGLVPLVVESFDMGARIAARDRALASSAPVLAVLTTETDTVLDRLRAGVALARVLLRAAAEGVSASFFNQAVDVPVLKERLRDLAGTPDLPQLLMRFGYGPPVPATARRGVDAVLR
jgi:hypothetical protein